MAVNNLVANNLATITTFKHELWTDEKRQGISVAKTAGKYKG